MKRESDSKYFRKHFIVEEVGEMVQYQCPYEYCNKIFAVDEKWLDTGYEIDDDFEYEKVTCPYCGRTWRAAI